MRQNDDIGNPDPIYKNYTVARAREDCTWKSNEDDIRMIACIYLCG
jgi:hypothetical protein